MKNESADDPVVIPARAPLPAGAANYVTPRGLAMLRDELETLEKEHAQTQINESDETERTRQLALLNGRIAALNQRIATAKVVVMQDKARDEVRFGATVTLHSRNTDKADRQLTIVGVDESDAIHGRIAFLAPIARLVLGKKIGDVITLRTPQGENLLEIRAIYYND
ncbi:transcription elongation factor GreB [Spirosoma pulveris]